MPRPLVPITTAEGFSLSASLQITFPASPSTILATDFTYFNMDPRELCLLCYQLLEIIPMKPGL